MNENFYYIKYLKYKMKYLKEKEMQFGGGETAGSIFFFSTSKDFNFLSNFYECNFTDPLEIKDGKLIEFNCNEQYFMYQKAKTCNSTVEVKNQILAEKVPRKVQKLGVKGGIIIMSKQNGEDWEKIKEDVMRRGLALKFSQSQNKELKDKLIRTGKKTLYEANPHDDYWGIYMNEDDAMAAAMAAEKEDKQVEFTGKNRLGILLMELRDEFRKNYNYTVE
jgi:ribA/ribD-fused uncharacterized protein